MFEKPPICACKIPGLYQIDPRLPDSGVGWSVFGNAYLCVRLASIVLLQVSQSASLSLWGLVKSIEWVVVFVHSKSMSVLVLSSVFRNLSKFEAAAVLSLSDCHLQNEDS